MTEFKEDVMLVAVQMEVKDRDEMHRVLPLALPRPNTYYGGRKVVCWWIAEDDRQDGSDNDSAVFVHPGNQQAAVKLLHDHGMTADCNLTQGTEPHNLGWEPPEPTTPSGLVDTEALLRLADEIEQTENSEDDGEYLDGNLIAAAIRAVVTPGLPRDEDGAIITSAEFGEAWFVRIFYNTDPEGEWVEEGDWSNVTLHGEFASEAEAMAWMEAYPDGDTDIRDMDVVVVNRVRREE